MRKFCSSMDGALCVLSRVALVRSRACAKWRNVTFRSLGKLTGQKQHRFDLLLVPAISSYGGAHLAVPELPALAA